MTLALRLTLRYLFRTMAVLHHLVSCLSRRCGDMRFLAILVVVSSLSHAARADESDAPGSALLAASRTALVDIKMSLSRIRGEVSWASGFVLNNPRWVVTNVHAIDALLSEPDLYRVRVLGAQGQHLHARVIALDVASDLALLQTDLPLNTRPLSLATQLPPAGETVYAIGKPSHRGFIVVEGRIDLLSNGEQGTESLEFTGTLESGMSGGPVLNARGEVVAVNRAVFLEPPRHSDLVAVPPLKRLLAQAAQQPYADHEGLRQDIIRQHRAWASHRAQSVLRIMQQREPLGPFLVPSSSSDCEGGRFSEADDDFDVYRLRCAFNWDAESETLLPEPGYQMRHFWLHQPGFHRLQSARAAQQVMEYLRNQPVPSHRHRGSWQCRSDRLTNAERITLDIQACRRGYPHWPGFHDHRLRVVALIPGRDALVSALDMNGIDPENARRMTVQWLDAIGRREQVRRAQP